MRKIVQVVGIPGSGKSYLFRGLSAGGVNYIEFGDEFRKWCDEQGIGRILYGSVPERVKEFIDSQIIPKQPIVFTSHMAHWTGREFYAGTSLEGHISPAGYIHILSPAEDILRRRVADNESGKKKRDTLGLNLIQEHQRISLSTVLDVAQSLNVPVLQVQNYNGNAPRNIQEMDNFIRSVLLNES